MARSTVERLDPKIKAAAVSAIARGATVDEIAATIGELGGDVSRSAVGRWAKNWRKVADQQRDIATVARAFGSEFGAEGNDQVRVLTQIFTSVVTKLGLRALTANDDDAEEGSGVSAMDAHFFAKACKDLASARKLDVETVEKIRDAARKQALDEASKVAEKAARDGGASPETINRIKSQLLGLKAAA
ncbi:MAG: phage protein Gp27 family protein [Sphingomonadaceae bacterium]|nr:phage protein Gp27 family protein [Sphingomonadaceae bacterium]